jgi:hypothetical protein
MFGVVVVPGHTIIVQEGEQLCLALQQSLAIAFGHVRAVRLSGDGAEEALHVSPMLAQVSLP